MGKKAFFYWLDEGMVEISVELSADLTGTWKTIDNNLSAKVGQHYVASSGTVKGGYNLLEIPILKEDETVLPVGFGVEVEDTSGNIIQALVVLQPFEYED